MSTSKKIAGLDFVRAGLKAIESKKNRLHLPFDGLGMARLHILITLPYEARAQILLSRVISRVIARRLFFVIQPAQRNLTIASVVSWGRSSRIQ